MDWIAGVVDMKEGVRDEWCIYGLREAGETGRGETGRD